MHNQEERNKKIKIIAIIATVLSILSLIGSGVVFVLVIDFLSIELTLAVAGLFMAGLLGISLTSMILFYKFNNQK